MFQLVVKCVHGFRESFYEAWRVILGGHLTVGSDLKALMLVRSNKVIW